MQRHDGRLLPNKGSRPAARVRYIIKGIINYAIISHFVVHNGRLQLNGYMQYIYNITHVV